MKRFLYNIMSGLCALTAVFASCQKELDGGEDRVIEREPGKTVTLTIHGPSAADTKTYLEDDMKVYWHETDTIEINGSLYGVTPDLENPSVATVKDVAESDSYLAVYNSWLGMAGILEDGNGYIISSGSQSYSKNSFGQYDNNMVAYSTDKSLRFYNINGILKMPVTGNGEIIRRIYVSGNNGEYVNGCFLFDKQSLLDGNPVFEFSPDFILDGRSTTLLYDCGEGVVLGEEATNFYFCLPPAAYSKGISVILETVDGRIAKKSSSNELVIERSVIKETAVFEFVQYAPELQSYEATPTSIPYALKGEPGAEVKTFIIFKEYWDRYVAGNPNLTSQQIANYLLKRDAATYVLDENGILSSAGNVALNNSSFRYMNADGEYLILAGYCEEDGSVTNSMISEVISTLPAQGTVPTLTLTPVPVDPDYSFKTISLNVKASDAAYLVYSIYTKAVYENAIASGWSDQELVRTYGYYLTDETYLQDVLSADGKVFYFSNRDDNTEYVVLVMVVSEGGAVAVEKIELNTTSYIPEGSTWELVTEDATLHCGMIPGSLPFDLSGITVYKNSDVDIFKVSDMLALSAMFSNNDLKNAIDKQGWKADITNEYWFYVDARNHDFVTLENNVNYIAIYEKVDGQDLPLQLVSARYFDSQYNAGTYNEEKGVLDLGDICIVTQQYWYYRSERSVLYLKDVPESVKTKSVCPRNVERKPILRNEQNLQDFQQIQTDFRIQ